MAARRLRPRAGPHRGRRARSRQLVGAPINMTKLRPPLSIDAALARIAGRIDSGWAGMAKIAGRKERTVRNWGDPDTVEQIPMDAAIALDLAHLEQGGDSTPIFDAYSTMLQAAMAERFSQPIALGRLLPDVIRECAQAEIAIALAAQPGASIAERAIASREVDEAMVSLGKIRPLLRTDLQKAGNPERQPP